MSQSKTISPTLGVNLDTLKKLFHADVNVDIVFREFKTYWGTDCFIVYVDGMADQSVIADFILRPLMAGPNERKKTLFHPKGEDGDKDSRETRVEEVVQMSNTQVHGRLDDAVTGVLLGDTAIFQEGVSRVVVCETKGFERRSVSNPTSEVVIKGSQESFTESIRTNITLIRRIIKSHELITEFVTVGDLNKNLCAILFLDGVVNQDTLKEVRRRLNNIKGDFIMGSGMLEQMIEDRPFSLFPSVLSTERPDRVSSYLADGRIALVCDGSPFVIVLPISIAVLLDSPEGSTDRWINGSFPRLLRIIALLVTTMLSGVYLALINYHREMIPTQLLSAIVASQANVPFPSLLEVLLMELAFELVREASLRTPSVLGGTIGVVGALILGQSAVEANLVSPVTLVVVALSGLCNSVLPDYDLAFGIRVLKITFIVLGSLLGFLGIAIGLILSFTMLANQTSFGVPMLSMQTIKWGTGSPIFLQLPLWLQRSRFRGVHPQKTEKFPRNARRWDTSEEDPQ